MKITETYVVCDGCGSRRLLPKYPSSWPTLKVDRSELRYCSRNCLKYSVMGRQAPSPGSSRGLPVGMTDRDIEVISMMARGQLYDVIADKLGIATSTLKNRVQSLMRIMEVGNRTSLVVRAHVTGLIRLEKIMEPVDL